MAKELYTKNIIPEQTLEDLFYREGQGINKVYTGGTYVGNQTIGGAYKTAETGARTELYPDPNTGIVCYDADNSKVFEVIIAGTNVGDVIFGDLESYYLQWDKSAGKLNMVGGTISNSILTGLSAGSELAIQGWQFSGTFSATDYRIVAWTAGTITLMDGTTFSIDAGNTGNMAALTYIYFSKADSETVLQKTTTAATAVGSNKILIAVAQDNADTAKDATFQVYGGSGGVGTFITADNIAATTITANEIATNTITANKLNVSQLSAITANLGTITAASVTVGSGGYIRQGQTAYNTGTGFWIGDVSGTPKLSIGNPTANYITWDGSILTIAGKLSHVAGNILYSSADTLQRTTSGSYAIEKEIKIYRPGTYRIKFDLQVNTKHHDAPSLTAYGRIYRNGVAVGTERTNDDDTSFNWETFTEDISGWSADDNIQLYTKISPSDGWSQSGVQNFRIYVLDFDKAEVIID